jgi:hypothetical protein
MKMGRGLMFGAVAVLAMVVLMSGGVYAASLFGSGSGARVGSSGSGSSFQGTNNWQYNQPSFNTYYSSSDLDTYWPILKQIENDNCEAGSDFIVGIPPGGCTPGVVRSDLLAEQNVPVFCQLDAVRINPLIKVSAIKSISFKGDYPEGVAGISYHPARAAVRTYKTLLGSPILNNIGYVVISLKREKVEDNMEDWIAGNLTATITYDADEAYGTGKSEFYLPAMNDVEWSQKYAESNFWNGKGYLRVKSVDKGIAKVDLYTDKNNVFRSLTLKEGETSSLMYFPGFYCRAGLKIRLNKVVAPEDKARLDVNGNEVWVRKGSKILDGKCSVNGLNVLGDGTGSVDISCPGQRVNLVLQRYGAEISVGDSKKEYKLGKLIASGEAKSVKSSKNVERYLGYVGKVPVTLTGTGKEASDFIVLVSSVNEIDGASLSSISSGISKLAGSGSMSVSSFKDKVKSSITGFFNTKREVVVLMVGDGEQIGDNEVKFIGLSQSSKDAVGEVLVDKYFTEANKTVDELVETYPQDSRATKESFAEETLFEQIKLAREVGKSSALANLIQKFLGSYPDSPTADVLRRDLISLKYFDYEQAYKVVYIGNEYHTLGVSEFKSVGQDEASTTVSVGGKTGVYTLDDEIYYNGKDNSNEGKQDDYLVVRDIEPNYVSFDYYDVSGAGKDLKVARGKRFKVDDKDSIVKGDKSVLVKEIKVKEVAYVSVLPEVKNTQTQANFTFKIGIEKRGIELSPEKTKLMIKNLKATIEKWEDINENLGNLVKGWKGACFATSSLLMAKNFVAGFSGESLARQKVMKHYKEICAKDHKGLTPTECYNELAPKIKEDVKAMQDAINRVNGKMDGHLKGKTSTGGFFGIDRNVVNQKGYVDALRGELGEKNVIVKDANGDNVTLKPADLTTASQIKSVLLAREFEGAGGIREAIAQKEMHDALRGAVLMREATAQTNLWKASVPEAMEDAISGQLVTGQSNIHWSGKSYSRDELFSELVDASGPGGEDFVEQLEELGDKKLAVQLVPAAGGMYMVTLQPSSKSGSNQMVESGIYKVRSSGNDNGMLVIEKKVKRLPTPSKYSFVKGGECRNSYKKPEIRYFDSGANKGLPAIVPFDKTEGWYVIVPNSAGTFLENVPKGYKASGDVSYFKICNVGPDGLMGNGIFPDDVCQTFDVNNYNKVTQFIPCPSMSAKEVQNLAERARQAIREASSQFGQRRVTILGQTFDTGAPMTDTGNAECQDFMSPEDCKILFNVCDPVICPSSRCNLAGKMNVANVVQTGIIGSIALCLPNVREGILVPVCLTGIHAGLDSYTSILKSEQQCLQKSLDTGEHVGICDEITSIYMCEFFWRQVAPVFDIIIPKIIELSYGNQGVRGGGEYLTITHAWDNLGKSVDFFRDSYAQNAFKAFEVRSVEEAGGEFCKAFVGTTIPTSADALDSLLAPESPTQFYAWFSERTFSEATVPASSQYKTYYHIYAGNDKGVYYRVYLKDPPASSYYRISPSVLVKTGYIAAGESADESIDFTAPEGYKQLCVTIDAQEHCGFKQVSTDFGLEYVRKKYVEDQAETTDITDEGKCISGTPSAWPVINPNLQAGVEEAVRPDIALRGIVRICATNNPEFTTTGNDSSFGRWKDVGYCGDPQIRCWLDTKSVEKDLKELDAIEGTLSDLNGEKAKLDGLRKSYGDVRGDLSRLETEIKNLNYGANEVSIEGAIAKVIGELNKIIGIGVGEAGQGANIDKAEAYSLKAQVYQNIVRFVKGKGIKSVTKEDVEKAKAEAKAEEKAELAAAEETLGGDITYETLAIEDAAKMFFDLKSRDDSTGIYAAIGNYLSNNKANVPIFQEIANSYEDDPNYAMQVELLKELLAVAGGVGGGSVAEKEEEPSVEGFVLIDTEIYYYGAPTGMSLIDEGAFYAVIETVTDNELGKIINGRINMGTKDDAESDDVEGFAELLAGWKLDERSMAFEYVSDSNVWQYDDEIPVSSDDEVVRVAGERVYGIDVSSGQVYYVVEGVKSKVNLYFRELDFGDGEPSWIFYNSDDVEGIGMVASDTGKLSLYNKVNTDPAVVEHFPYLKDYTFYFSQGEGLPYYIEKP